MFKYFVNENTKLKPIENKIFNRIERLYQLFLDVLI